MTIRLSAHGSKLYLKLAISLLLPGIALFALSQATATGSGPNGISVPPIPTSLFGPSNARTESGQTIPTAQFFPATRCAGCHRDTHTAWSASLHRNAGREPFYKESVDLLQQTRGIEFTRHCESCHAPVAMLSGALTKGSKELRSMDDEGVTCSVCHAITEARADGTGSYTIRRPALLVREDGTPVFGDMPDSTILADISGHRRAMMRPLLKQPEFCATCHKSTAPPELNGYKYTRGFNSYDEWQQSGASHEAALPFYRKPERMDCRTCHMPKIASADDIAAKAGKISSHRWLGANTAAPLFYQQNEQAAMTDAFLKANVLSVDIFSIKRSATGESIAPLAAQSENCIKLQPDEEITAEVVISNRNAAHSFPPELRDLYEAWVEFEAIDAKGQVLFRSGQLQPDGTLDQNAHVYRAILLDEGGTPLLKHEVWRSVIKAYDNAIPAGRSDVIRFRFRINQGATSAITLKARVNYRRFIKDYSDYVLSRQKRSMTIPVVRMAESQVVLTDMPEESSGSMVQHATGTVADIARRWNDYGIGLLEQSQYGAAADAFRQAALINPSDPNLLVNAAIAEMRTEQYNPVRTQLQKAATLLNQALRIDPKSGRARFYRALVLRGQGDAAGAAQELTMLSQEYPRDREIQRQLGQTVYGLGRIADAQRAFETVRNIDPTDAGAYQFLSPIYASEGRTSDAAAARSLYLLWRDDPLADGIAGRFFSKAPQWAEERVGVHTHGVNSPQHLTGNVSSSQK